MKDAYYFSHDNNASSDPKMQEMLSVYKGKGYGWFWMLIELMHQQTSHKLKINGEHSHNIYARYCWADDDNEFEKFIKDCIERFTDEKGGLFVSNDKYFWSNSLLQRIEKRNEISKKRIRAGKKGGFATASKKDLPQQSCSKTPAGKERKGKEIKESKYGLYKHVLLTQNQYDDLIKEHGEELIKSYIQKVDDYCETHGRRYERWKSAIQTYIRNDVNKGKLKVTKEKICPKCKKQYIGSFCTCGWSESDLKYGTV